MKYSARKSLKCLMFPETVPNASCLGRPSASSLCVFRAIISELEALGHCRGWRPAGVDDRVRGRGPHQLPPRFRLPQTAQLLVPLRRPRGWWAVGGPLPVSGASQLCGHLLGNLRRPGPSNALSFRQPRQCTALLSGLLQASPDGPLSLQPDSGRSCGW